MLSYDSNHLSSTSRNIASSCYCRCCVDGISRTFTGYENSDTSFQYARQQRGYEEMRTTGKKQTPIQCLLSPPRADPKIRSLTGCYACCRSSSRNSLFCCCSTGGRCHLNNAASWAVATAAAERLELLLLPTSPRPSWNVSCSSNSSDFGLCAALAGDICLSLFCNPSCLLGAVLFAVVAAIAFGGIEFLLHGEFITYTTGLFPLLDRL